MKITLSPIERRALKAKAHELVPVVMIGDHGLTPAIIREVDRNLKAHELIKIRASTDDREQRIKWFDEICDALNAAPVQHIGKIYILWRHSPELLAARAKAALPPTRRKAARVTKRQEENRAAGITKKKVR
jgi:RNA-binding protein